MKNIRQILFFMFSAAALYATDSREGVYATNPSHRCANFLIRLFTSPPQIEQQLDDFRQTQDLYLRQQETNKRYGWGLACETAKRIRRIVFGLNSAEIYQKVFSSESDGQ